ncbi:MAG: stage II sporulation protein M [Gammaproteobacteria bacterium]|nr:stage II sporulation protein M [Gammaproteobacteria bacterium]
MRQEEFEHLHAENWQQFKQLLDEYEVRAKRNKMKAVDLKRLPEHYRNICHCLAIAKQRQYSPYLIEHLDTLVLRGHQIIYTKHDNILVRVIEFIAHGFPRKIQQHLSLFWLTTFVFYGPGAIMFGLTMINPELIYSLVPVDQVVSIESMYDPEQRVLGRERDSDTDFYMFGHYIQNNIGIGFRTFATGILFTLGSLFFLIFNGLFFGAISAHIVNVKYTSTFFPFVIGHGSFELTAIVISGMAGILLGWSLIAPGNLKRIEALKLAAQNAIGLMYGAVLLFLIAAFVEAFWSSSTNLTINTKYTVGTIFWVLVLAYLLWPRKPMISSEASSGETH